MQQLQQLDTAQAVATITAFALALSKFARFTLPLWSRLPATAQRWLPGLALVVGEVPNALSGATTWPQIALALLGAIAFATPGKHAALPPAPAKSKDDDKGPPTMPSGGLVGMLALVLLLVGCGGSSEPPRFPSWLLSFTPAEIDAGTVLLRGACNRLDVRLTPLQRKVCAALPPEAAVMPERQAMPSSGLGAGGAPGPDGGAGGS